MKDKIVWEIGKNHLGNYHEAVKLVKAVGKTDCKIISLQVREGEFYDAHANLSLTIEEYKNLFGVMRENGLQIYLALGPIMEHVVLDELLPLVDGVKLLYMTLLNKEATEIIIAKANALNLHIYFSTGALDISKTEHFAQQYAGVRVLHTKLSHEIQGQEIANISLVRQAGLHCAFGQHCADWTAIAVAIGAGAGEIFVYVGDKTSRLPDHEHAIDINDLDHFINYVSNAYSALEAIQGKQIEFIG